MTNNTNRQTLGEQMTGLAVQTDKFKTTRISLSFVLPLTVTDASTASLLAKLLSRSTKQYASPTLLQRKLLSLYGARLSSGMIKLADHQLLNVSITVADDQYALNGEKLIQEATALLCESVFHPNFSQSTVPTQDLEICRRLLIESIESTINDKRKYALSQMYGFMCQDEPFGIEIGGNLSSAKAVSGEQVVAYWQAMLCTAPIVITVVGANDPAPIYEQIITEFDGINRAPKACRQVFSYAKPTEVRTKVETMKLTQGKLVMGFRSPISSVEQDNMALRMMCDIYGGAPYSKLFTVVREKMSLCYYCGSRIQSQKGFICVDSGVDEQNIEAAKRGILDQLVAIQQGDFDDAVISAAKMSMIDGVISVTDSQSSIEAWYLARLFDRTMQSPEEFIEQVNRIQKKQIVEAARGVVLDTVYVLKGTEEAQ
ncbi:MAG: insulinase family protein [Clostridia bacterium]|nr:insulinase family protein [Clostridia bacterium]